MTKQHIIDTIMQFAPELYAHAWRQFCDMFLEREGAGLTIYHCTEDKLPWIELCVHPKMVRADNGTFQAWKVYLNTQNGYSLDENAAGRFIAELQFMTRVMREVRQAIQRNGGMLV